jgi:hypothetical protein
MYESIGGDYINKGVDAIYIKEANTRGSWKSYKKQLGALKRIRLNSYIALDSCIGQESWGSRGSSRVVS